MRRHSPANGSRASAIGPGEFSAHSHRLAAPLMGRGADDPNGVPVSLPFKLDPQLTFGTKINRMIGGKPAARQAEINEPNLDVTNESGFQMTHMCFPNQRSRHQLRPSAVKRRCEQRSSSANGRLQSLAAASPDDVVRVMRGERSYRDSRRSRAGFPECRSKASCSARSRRSSGVADRA